MQLRQAAAAMNAKAERVQRRGGRKMRGSERFWLKQLIIGRSCWQECAWWFLIVLRPGPCNPPASPARLHPPGCVVFGKTCSRSQSREGLRWRDAVSNTGRGHYSVLSLSMSLAPAGLTLYYSGMGCPLLGGMPNIFIVRHARHDDGESQFCHSSALVKRVQISYWGSQVDYVMEVSLPTNDNGIPIKRTVNRFYYCVRYSSKFRRFLNNGRQFESEFCHKV